MQSFVHLEWGDITFSQAAKYAESAIQTEQKREKRGKGRTVREKRHNLTHFWLWSHPLLHVISYTSPEFKSIWFPGLDWHSIIYSFNPGSSQSILNTTAWNLQLARLINIQLKWKNLSLINGDHFHNLFSFNFSSQSD